MTSCGSRCESNERALLTAGSALFLFTWTALYLTDVNHPPGVRTARIAGAALAIGIGILEYSRRWWGFYAFLILWPQMMVARELLQMLFGPAWGALPTITAGPLAASLTIGFALHQMKFPKKAAAPEINSTSESAFINHSWIRIALWCLAFIWTLSAAIATARLWNIPPAGWHVDPADWRHASGPSAYSALAPAASALRIVPEFLLGLMLFNVCGRNSNPPTNNLLKCIAASTVLVTLEILLQLVLNRNWAFDENPPGGPFNNRNTAAPILVIFGVLVLAAQMHRPNGKVIRRTLATVCIGLGCSLLSRNGLFSAGVLAVVYLTLSLQRRWIVFAAMGAAAAIFLWAPLPKSETISSVGVRRVILTIEELRAGDWNAVTSYRSELYVSALKIFGKYPLCGSGPATFPMLASPGSIYAVSGWGAYFSAHSMPLNLAAEIGIIGALAWILLWLVFPAVVLWRERRISWLWISVLMIGVANLLDTVWFAAGMGTLSMMILWLACRENEDPQPLTNSILNTE